MGIRLLVVDDDPGFRETLRVLLAQREEAYRRTALAAGAEAFLVKKTLGVDLWPTLLRIVKKEQGQPT